MGDGAEYLSQLGQLRRIPRAEDGAHDHLQRDRPGLPRHSNRGPDGPPLDALLGLLANDLFVAPDGVAMEGRQQTLASGHVLVLVEYEHAAGAEDRLEEAPVAVPGMEDLGRAGEDFLDQCRVGDRDNPAKGHDLHREHVAIAALGPASVGHEPLEREIALNQHREAGAAGRRDRRGRRRAGGCRT